MNVTNEIETVLRYTLTASLLFGAYTTFYCPCKKNSYLSCHIKEFSLATGIPLSVALAIYFSN